MMGEEIDLRAYLGVLGRHWKWIVGLALIAAVIAFVMTSLQPDTYQASAVVIVTRPRYQMQFDPRFETSQNWTPAYAAFPTLATSDGILQEVVEAYTPSPEAAIDDWRLGVLSGMVEASSGGDPSLLLLKVHSRSPQDAAAIANTWGDLVVQAGNEIFGDSAKDVDFFKDQVAQAAQALDEADAALIEFEAHNQSNIISTQLDSLNQAQAEYLNDQRTISYIIQDIQGLRRQLAHQLSEQPDDQSMSFADGLTVLLLQIKAFNARIAASDASAPAPASAPIELQIDNSASLSNKTLAEQVVFLDDLVTTLQSKSAEADARLLELEPQILASQQALQQLTAEQDRLTRAQEVVRETYLTLVRKLDEARIAAQEENGALQVGSYAAVPESPVGPRRLFNTAVAGMLGLMLGILAAFSIEFWRRSGTQTQDTEEPLRPTSGSASQGKDHDQGEALAP
jgi:succinoglycan biosynthesis transport protein ExoP